jgi:hypothetical protein
MYITVAGKRSGSCTNCGWTGPTKEKTETLVECPGCKKTMQAKSEVRSGQSVFTDYVSVVQRIESGVMIRRLEVRIDTSTRPAEIRSIEIVRTVWPDGAKKPIRYTRAWGTPDEWEWHPWHRTDYYQYLHPSAAEELRGTRWQYSGLPEAGKHRDLPVEMWFKAYLKIPALEMLAKMRMWNLMFSALYSMNDPGDYASKDPEKVVGVPKRFFKVVAGANLEQPGVRYMSKLIRLHGADPTIQDMQRLTRSIGYQDQLFDRPSLKSVPFRVTMDYLHARQEDPHLYYDYLRMTEELRLDIKDTDVLRPRNLKEAHDRIAERLHQLRIQKDLQKREQEAKLYKNAVSEMAKTRPSLEKTWRGMMTVIPKDATELVREGETLHHCVANYASRVAAGECIIVFVRQVEEPDMPFVTVEVKGDRVVQARGKNNAIPPPEVEKWIKTWTAEWSKPAKAARRGA